MPHARQKRARSGFSSWQLGQTITARVYELGAKVARLATGYGGYGRAMDEARSVLERLERIEALERRGSPAGVMLAELRELVAEAEAWVRVEPGPTEGAEDAIERLRQAVCGLRVRGEDSASLTRKHARNGLFASATSSRGRGHGHLGRSRCDKGHRVRQPEGRRGEDHVHAQPRRGVRRAGPPRARRRPRPAGQPHDEPGAQPRHDRALDVRRARPPAADRAGAAQGGDRPRRLVDRPGGRRARAVQPDRPRARSREGAGAGARTTTTGSSSTRRRRSAC